ncbi:MAG: TMEM165/GDT1 family protein [Thermodesulfobacteriota bacterium]
MDLKLFFTIFGAIFLAELGDKTQLATMLFATDGQKSKATVFLASTLALVLASGVAVLFGSVVSRYIDTRYLSWIAGVGFIVIGLWTIIKV